MSCYHVYLAGPITGLNYEGATAWRDSFAQQMPGHIKCLSPMRFKEYLVNEASLDPMGYEAHPLCTPVGIMTRDHFDCTRADVIVVNLLDADKVSVGTVMELAWAFDNQIPVVAIMEPGNVHEHAMLNQTIGFRVGSLGEAAEIVQAILV